MKAVVIGSMNIDFTMDLDHLPSKGETVPAVRLRTSPEERFKSSCCFSKAWC